MRASSRGTAMEANRLTPALSPSASRRAAPSADAHVFNGVVSVNGQVATGFQPEVPAAVAAQLGDHVVKKRQTGSHLDLAGSRRSKASKKWRFLWSRARWSPPGSGWRTARSRQHLTREPRGTGRFRLWPRWSCASTPPARPSSKCRGPGPTAGRGRARLVRRRAVSGRHKTKLA